MPPTTGAWPRARGQLVDAVDAVLHRQNGRLRPDHRRDHAERGRIVVGLDRDEDDVHGPTRRGVLFGRAPHREVPECRTANLESARANGRQVRAARDEGHVVPRAGELRAVVAANRAGAENGESHLSFQVPGSGFRVTF